MKSRFQTDYPNQLNLIKMQKVITVTVTAGAGRVRQTENKEDRFVGEHEYDKLNTLLEDGYVIINVIQTPGSNTGSLHPTAIITFILEKK